MKMKTWKKAMLILLMLALSLIFVSPILLLLNSSFKELKEIYAYERILGPVSYTHLTLPTTERV